MGPDTVLVVDDHEDNREFVCRRLEREGYRTLAAASGPEALELIRREPVSLVLLDVMMPSMDGIEVLARIRERHPPSELPVIMLTARAEGPEVVDALARGANDYVTKPFDLEVTVARVQAQLRVRRPPSGSGDLVATPDEIHPGMVLGGRYRLEDRIGSGSFGTVYRARHLELGHPVAVKVLRTTARANPDALKRFRREGRSASRVKHPNAVQTIDFGVTPRGIGYLVMELLAGYSLEQELRDGRRIPPDRALRLTVPVCQALAAAHRSRIIHRDIKPSNIFLHQAGGEEVPKVLDFGIARIADEAAEPGVTVEGFIVGTPAYMAPERFRPGGVDGKADVYGVGVTLFQMLAGRLPFEGPASDPLALGMRHLHEPPPALRAVAPGIGKEVESAVGQALAKDPRDRPTAHQLAEQLARAGGWRARRAADRA